MPLVRYLALLAGGGLLLTACSSSGGAAPRTTQKSTAQGSNAGTGSGPGGTRGPAAFGTIAAINGTTMQVQNQQSGQTAVTWTKSTTFTHQVAITTSAIKAGSCVTALGATGSSVDATSFTAASVTVNPARNGSCGGEFVRRNGGPSGAAPSGFPSGRPSGLPSAFPSGGKVGRVQAAAAASGKVTAVSGTTLTIAAQRFGSSATTTKTVTISAHTKITTQAATTAKSLAVGKCVVAEGKADSSGTVTATRVQITDATNGQCAIGFGRFGGNGG